jgi:hypothetical protein
MQIQKTYLEKIIDEAIRPTIGAVEQLVREIAQSMQIPDAPWKILNKKYDELTEQELLALADIYHTEGEGEPCPFCQWVSKEELKRNRQEMEEFGGNK